MDTITQAALGAAVGEIVLGRKVGNKALLYGAIGGTIPDLDVFVRPFFSDLEYLGYHRGFSHSFMFAALFAPVLAFYINKWHKNSGSDWIGWSWLIFWAIVTHPILDSFTVYGTQFFLPFTDYPIAFNNIFIIDFIYTLPLVLGVFIILFFRRDSEWRHRIHWGFFGIAHLYLFITIVTKIYMHNVFMTNFENKGIEIDTSFSVPMMFNILWGTASVSQDTIYVGSYSFYDSDQNIELHKIPRNSHLIAGQENSRAIQKLEWFSQDVRILYEIDNETYWADLRFGFPDQHTDTTRNFTFSFKLIRDENGDVVNFERAISPGFRGGLASGSFWERAWEMFQPVWRRMFNMDGEY